MVTINTGKMFMTRGIANLAADDEKVSMQILRCLYRHKRGDWGNVCPESIALNNEALENGGRLLSAYNIVDSDGNNITIWIITEADRSLTTILLPEEY
jgi:hypothetical protein